MPIIANFPGGSGSGGGLTLSAVTEIKTLAAHNRAYIKWTDPEDLIVAGAALATWGGTLLVRKAGSMPKSRLDGTIVIDNKKRNEYKDKYFCDSSLSDGETYYYKFFPYTTANSYTDSAEDEFSVTPNAVAVGDVSAISAVAAGNGKLNLKWTDPDEKVIDDGETLATWASTKVVVKTGGYATSPDEEGADYTYTSTTRNAYTSTPLNITGLVNGTTYYISLFPVSTEDKVNTNEKNRTTGIPNRLVVATVPSQSGSLTYTGLLQSPTWNNYEESQLTLGGQTSQTNAGTYDATFTPKDDYCWDGGNMDEKTVQWTIDKAPGSLSINPQSITLNANKTSDTITVTREGNGEITAEVGVPGIVTTSVVGEKVTVTSVNNTTGKTTVTIKVAEGTNHTAPASVECSVDAQFMPPKGNDLDTYTWEQINQISEAKQGDDYFDVGDCHKVTIDGTVGAQVFNNLTTYVYILGFDHRSEGGITFGGFKTAAKNGKDVCLVDSNYNSYKYDGTKCFNLNHWGQNSGNYNTNFGGWKGCDARYDILGSTDKKPSEYGQMHTTSCVGYDASTTTATNPVENTLMAALPVELRKYMKPMTVYTDNYGNSSNTQDHVTTSVDYLPLLAEFEIFGTRTYANEHEQKFQTQYKYYENGNPKIKYRHDTDSAAAYWWERSPGYNTAIYFCIVGTNGTASSSYSRNAIGLAPAFKI